MIAIFIGFVGGCLFAYTACRLFYHGTYDRGFRDGATYQSVVDRVRET